MQFQGADNSEEQVLARRCLAGDEAALSTLRGRFLEPVLGLLVSRGVAPTLARDVIDTLWADCVVEKEGQPGLLDRFNGKWKLRTWLFRIALNRAFDRGRQAQRISYMPAGPAVAQADQLMLADLPISAGSSEPILMRLLRESLEAGFEACPAEDLLKLRLVFLHGVTQRELARLWQCHETTIARDLRRSLQLIADQTLSAARKRDPWLTLRWEDFLDLCGTEALDFI